jgi:cathepsin A (carboxypeptidase C)
MQAYAPIQELNMYNMYAECYQGPDSAANATHPHEMFLFKNNFYIQHMLTVSSYMSFQYPMAIITSSPSKFHSKASSTRIVLYRDSRLLSSTEKAV